MKKHRVVFLHPKRLVNAGSKIMRCDQLCDIARRYLGDRYDFEVRMQLPVRDKRAESDMCSLLSDATVIMIKGTAQVIGEEAVATLKTHARGLCVDYVDINMQENFLRFADVHIAPSIAGMRILRGLLASRESAAPGASVAHLTHHADPRLEGLGPPQSDKLRVVYLGNPKNALIPRAVNSKIEVLSYNRDREIGSVFKQLQGFNLHYAVRPPDQSSETNLSTTKPFTKGIVAAALGANVLASVDSDDALHYLGADYPFLLKSGDEASINNAMEKAVGLFGGPEWKDALQRMEYVRAISSPANIAHELNIILERFT